MSVEELCGVRVCVFVCLEVRVDLQLALSSLWRRRNGGRGSSRQSDFLNLAVEEITLSHNASTLLDAPYVASSSSSSSFFYRLRLLIPLLLLLCMRVRTRTGESAEYNFRLEILLSLFGSFRLGITGNTHCDMFVCGYEINTGVTEALFAGYVE